MVEESVRVVRVVNGDSWTMADVDVEGDVPGGEGEAVGAGLGVSVVFE
jgi:hypothetical protein